MLSRVTSPVSVFLGDVRRVWLGDIVTGTGLLAADMKLFRALSVFGIRI